MPDFEAAFAAYFTQGPDGRPRYDDRPGGKHALQAYAYRPVPSVQVVTLDVFDTVRGAVRARLDDAQMTWLRSVLRRARADGVPWVIVQGHTPVLGPVRVRGSSGLQYDGGRRSELWRVFRDLGVDLYLCGEVHDVTAIERDGVTQLSHGGLYQFGLTNFLLADVYADRLELQLRDFDVTHSDRDPRLWESRPAGIPSTIGVTGPARTIGTAVLDPDGTLRDRTGILLPYTPTR
ncbi:unannotated protein [freshwater metagenome]|uniref:Unannotated protein n=1 Tax=freshwater metagenome TaxID=449393 RepID=A0A6J6RYK4_9ZZZZ